MRGKPPPPLDGAVRLGNPCRGGFAILCPIGAAAFDLGAAFRISGIGAESDIGAALQAIAATAKADKIFCDHSAAVDFGNQVTTLIGVPGAASGAAREGGHDVALDRGGDGGFLGHGGLPFRFHN